ncbi:MAG: hypothetical protein H6737_14680 [Alphaproteobacteria bacterium]|nr:hypothetical protein [Alphaproteobacteria bacterium]
MTNRKLSLAALALTFTACKGGGVGDTETDADTDTTNAYHPPGFYEPAVHGMEAKFQEQDCLACHGADLEGQIGPACSSCHPSDWKTTCTFCHGGVDSTTGAPPEDIDDNTDVALSPYRPHTRHLADGDHAPIPCETCHAVPDSALAEGHLFVGDSTPGQAEVTFSLLGTNGSWDGQACTVYCHGTGQGLGTVVHTDGPRSCDSCHPYVNSASSALSAMSGQHRRHVLEGIACGECHSTTADASGNIVGPAQHVDGIRQVALPQGMTHSGGTCSGACHGETHFFEGW